MPWAGRPLGREICLPSRTPFTPGSPQQNTAAERKSQGIHAQATVRGVSLISLSAVGSGGPPLAGVENPWVCCQHSRGCHTVMKSAKAARLAKPPTTSTSAGPTKFAISACAMANEAPQTSTAGHTPASPRHPAIVTTIQAGMISEKNGSCRPAMAEIACSSSPVTFASVMIGVPRAPKATGAVLAISARQAASNAGKPAPVRRAAEIATGAPKPAAPSRNAPKAKAINSACTRWSAESRVTERFITSSAPASTARE